MEQRQTTISSDIQKIQEWFNEQRAVDQETFSKNLVAYLNDNQVEDVESFDNGIIIGYIGDGEQIYGLRATYSFNERDNNEDFISLLATINYLSKNNEGPRIKLFFEPEGEMIPEDQVFSLKDSVYQDVNALFGIQFQKGEQNRFVISRDAAYASIHTFKVKVQGQGGHAAYPQATVDALIVGAQIIEEFQLIQSRVVNPMSPTQVNVTSFEAGEGTYNIIADASVIYGHIRSLSEDEEERMTEMIERMAQYIAHAHRATVEVEITKRTPILYNDEQLMSAVKEQFQKEYGVEVVNEGPGVIKADYFARALEEKPGVMINLEHTETATIEEVIQRGVDAFAEFTKVKYDRKGNK